MGDKRRGGAFSLLEVLVAMGISALLLGLLLAAVNQFSHTAQHASGGASAFDEASQALGEIRRSLERATLGAYWAVAYDANGYPSGYHRQSDLHFLIAPAADVAPTGPRVSGDALFFQAPLGFETNANEDPGAVMNALGYFVEWGNLWEDHPLPTTPAPAPRWRYRLRELRLPGDGITVMTPREDGVPADEWVRTGSNAFPPSTLATNIAWMGVCARFPGTTGQAAARKWDSRGWGGAGQQPATSHQLPPLVEIALLALDEATAAQLEHHGATPPPLPLEGLFSEAAQFDADLTELEERLAAQWPRSAFRILRATVPIRAARWSMDPSAPALPDPDEEG